jgi:hypothetical protein
MDSLIRTFYRAFINNVHWTTKSPPLFPFAYLIVPNGPCKPFSSRFFYKVFYKVVSMATFWWVVKSQIYCQHNYLNYINHVTKSYTIIEYSEKEGKKSHLGNCWMSLPWNFSGVVVRPNSSQNLMTFCHKKNIILIIMCDMPWYRKMTHDSTMGKCYMGQSMQHVKIIKYGTYMVHKIFVHATLNTPNYVQHFPNCTHIAMNT